MDQLVLDLKKELIERLNLEGMTPDELDENTPLFGEGLGLDSIDALEIIVLLDKNYQIKITDSKDGKKIFYSIRTIADYITEQRKLAANTTV
jgi:acyl carrier protein